jgi:hypothetical protein
MVFTAGPRTYEGNVTAEIVRLGARASDFGDRPFYVVRLEDGTITRVRAPGGIVMPEGTHIVLAHYHREWPIRGESYRFVAVAEQEVRAQ